MKTNHFSVAPRRGGSLNFSLLPAPSSQSHAFVRPCSCDRYRQGVIRDRFLHEVIGIFKIVFQYGCHIRSDTSEKHLVASRGMPNNKEK